MNPPAPHGLVCPISIMYPVPHHGKSARTHGLRGSSSRRQLRTADDLPRHRTSRLSIRESDLAIYNCEFIAIRTLHESAAVSGQIEDHFRRMKLQPLEIDQVNIRLHARCERAAIEQAIKLRRVVRLALYCKLER